MLDPAALFSSVPTPVWAALSGALSGLGTWAVGMRQVSASIERARIQMNATALAEENAERAAFRTALMAEISELRQQMKECEADRDHLRTRVNAAEEQIMVLKASNEIMERWLAFFRDRNALEVGVPFEPTRTVETPGPTFRSRTGKP
jgi:hypothetical protein